MQELVEFARVWGPLAAILVYFAYKATPALLDKFLPDLMSARREEKKRLNQQDADLLTKLMQVYERLITSNERTVTFIGSASEALRAVQHALDDNTRVLATVIEAIRQGPKCPLPHCPYVTVNGGDPPSVGSEQPGNSD